ncbi:MAG: hypothetical protein CW694_03765 [Candidatus Syntrophoarchaeum sp. WYZ-LMO15]|nr:MAG: hypothetical protein CW694_03765 [Candidatus Syntrophoarchaeum sp. WYZ-LMO15]
MERGENEYESCLSHKILFISGILSFGLLDGLTAAIMINEKGVMSELNPFLREIVISYGAATLLIFKITVCFMILSVPLLVQYISKESMYWTINGFYGVFTVAGILAAMDNWIFMKMGDPFIDPRLVTGVTFLMLLMAINLGNMMDYRRNHANGYYCRSRITDKEWERMKKEMNYPD